MDRNEQISLFRHIMFDHYYEQGAVSLRVILHKKSPVEHQEQGVLQAIFIDYLCSSSLMRQRLASTDGQSLFKVPLTVIVTSGLSLDMVAETV